jgi:hypothetical protein
MPDLNRQAAKRAKPGIGGAVGCPWSVIGGPFWISVFSVLVFQLFNKLRPLSSAVRFPLFRISAFNFLVFQHLFCPNPAMKS